MQLKQSHHHIRNFKLMVLIFGMQLPMACFNGSDEPFSTIFPPPLSYEPGSLTPAAEFPGTPAPAADFESYFEFTNYTDESCNEITQSLTQALELRFFYHPRYEFNIQQFTRALARYYERYGISFSMRFSPIEVPLDWAINDSEDALITHLEDTFPDVNVGAVNSIHPQYAAILEETFEFSFAPLLDQIRVYGTPNQNVTEIILVPQILYRSAAEDEFAIAGLALSNVLLNKLQEEAEEEQSSAEASFWQGFPISTPFTPLIFLNAGFILNVATPGEQQVIIDLLIAHEFGHTLGLTHKNQSLNLMSPALESAEDITCQVSLDNSQIENINATLDNASQDTQTVESSLSMSIAAPTSTPSNKNSPTILKSWRAALTSIRSLTH